MGTESREYQKAIDYLCSLVKTDGLTIGSKLPTERKIAEILSIGRNSTREALRIMENMGVIECRQGSGNYIAGNMSKTISGIVEMMLLLRQVTKEEIIAFRRDMEKSICNLIIANGNIDIWYDKLMDTLAVDIESQSLAEQIEADWKFHYTLISATENQLWICISEAIMTIYQNWIDSVLRRADPDAKYRLQKSHMAILTALREGSRTRVGQAIDMHYDLADTMLSQFSHTPAADHGLVQHAPSRNE